MFSSYMQSVCVLPGPSESWEPSYFKIEETSFNTKLLTRISAYKQSLTMASKYKHLIQLLENDANE